MSCLVKKLRRFRRKEDGSATIEFVLLFPVFISLFLLGFESGFFMVRNVIFERAVDIAIRDVRLGNGRVPEFDDLKANICSNALLLNDCVDNIQIEMQTVQIVPGGIDPLRTPTRCVDTLSEEDQSQFTTFDLGEQNSMMVVRVCSLMQPFFPTTRLGAGLGVDSEGNVAMVVTSAFVNEPGTRDTAASATPASGGDGGGT